MFVDLLAGGGDRLAGVVSQLLDRPIVSRDADDRTLEPTMAREPVERLKGLLFRQVAGDPENHQGVRLRGVLGHRVQAIGCESAATPESVWTFARMTASVPTGRAFAT